MKIELGAIVQDTISGLEGIVLGRAEYAHNSPEVLVTPREIKDGKPMDGSWIKEARVKVLSETPPVGFMLSQG